MLLASSCSNGTSSHSSRAPETESCWDLRCNLDTSRLETKRVVCLEVIKDLFIKTGLFSSNDLCDMKPAQAGEGANCGWWLGVGAQRENFNARLQLKMLVLMQCSKLVQVFRQRCFLPRQRVGSYVRTTSISASAKSVKSPAKQKCRIQLGVRPTQSALLKYDIESIHIYIYIQTTNIQ